MHTIPDEERRLYDAPTLQAIVAAERDRTTIGYALSRFAAKQRYTFDEMRHWLTGTPDSTITLSPDDYLALAQAALPASYGALRTACDMTGASHARVQLAIDEARRYG